jgi:nucleoside-diphosphate-sugar epimerase
MPGLVRSWSDIDAYVACNILAVARLVEAARQANVRSFVQISTSSVCRTNAVGDESLPTRRFRRTA